MTDARRPAPHLGRTRRRRNRERVVALCFVLPWLIGLATFYIYPLVMTVFYSLTDFDGITFPPKFTLFDNFHEMFFVDPRFWHAVRNTAWWVSLSVPTILLLSFIAALLLNQRMRGLSILRMSVYLPSMVPAVGATLLFLWILNPNGGVLNSLLGRVGLGQPGWFTSPEWAKPALLLQAVWALGTTMIVFLAALQQVDGSLYEAAEMDGAGSLRRTWHVTLPSCVPAIFFNAVIAMVAAFTYFAPPLIVSSAPPGLGGGGGVNTSVGAPADSTLLLSVYIYDQFFSEFRFGYAAALSTFLAVVVVAVGALLYLIGRRLAPSEDES